MTFSSELDQLNISRDVSHCLLATSDSIRRLLCKSTYSFSDLPLLLSPAAEPFLEEFARKSRLLTQQRFGNTMQLFVPMYLSNECFNTCTYCGFSMEHKYQRKTLSSEEIIKEANLLADKGFSHILL